MRRNRKILSPEKWKTERPGMYGCRRCGSYLVLELGDSERCRRCKRYAVLEFIRDWKAGDERWLERRR